MNGRKLYREYAQINGKEAKEFVKIENEWYSQDTLITNDNKGNEERMTINYKDLVNWIIRNFNIVNKTSKAVTVPDDAMHDLYKHLSTMENYLKGEHNHETDTVQQKEDLKLYQETVRLKKLLFNYN